MDIAKIRKKVRDNQGLQDTARPRPEAEGGGADVSDRATPEALEPRQDISRESQGVGEPVNPIVELLTFRLTKEEYAFRVDEVQEIIKPQRITRIPRSRPYLIGITSLRGKIIPVIDLKAMLSLRGECDDERRQKILILKGTRGPLGVLIDRVINVIRPPASTIVETPAHLPEAEMRFIDGVAIVDGRFVSIIKTEEVLEAL